MDYYFLFLTLIIGYMMGVGSRWVVKTSLKDYIDAKITDLNNITTSYTQKVQIECDKLVDDAKQQAIAIYKEALNEASKVVHFDSNTSNLN